MVQHELTAKGFMSISESLETFSGSILRSSGSTLTSSGSIFSSRFAVEVLFAVDCVTMGCVTARFALTVTGSTSALTLTNEPSPPSLTVLLLVCFHW
jgi:hypothetical protein